METIYCHNTVPVEMYKGLLLIGNAKHHAHQRNLKIRKVCYIHAI